MIKFDRLTTLSKNEQGYRYNITPAFVRVLSTSIKHPKLSSSDKLIISAYIQSAPVKNTSIGKKKFIDLVKMSKDLDLNIKFLEVALNQLMTKRILTKESDLVYSLEQDLSIKLTSLGDHNKVHTICPKLFSKKLKFTREDVLSKNIIPFYAEAVINSQKHEITYLSQTKLKAFGITKEIFNTWKSFYELDSFTFRFAHSVKEHSNLFSEELTNIGSHIAINGPTIVFRKSLKNEFMEYLKENEYDIVPEQVQKLASKSRKLERFFSSRNVATTSLKSVYNKVWETGYDVMTSIFEHVVTGYVYGKMIKNGFDNFNHIIGQQFNGGYATTAIKNFKLVLTHKSYIFN